MKELFVGGDAVSVGESGDANDGEICDLNVGEIGDAIVEVSPWGWS